MSTEHDITKGPHELMEPRNLAKEKEVLLPIGPDDGVIYVAENASEEQIDQAETIADMSALD